MVLYLCKIKNLFWSNYMKLVYFEILLFLSRTFHLVSVSFRSFNNFEMIKAMQYATLKRFLKHDFDIASKFSDRSRC